MSGYRWLCTEKKVVLGPYGPGDFAAWIMGVKTMSANGLPEPVVITTAGPDIESAARKLARLNASR